MSPAIPLDLGAVPLGHSGDHRASRLYAVASRGILPDL